jgi:hypothetical protein
MPIDSVDVSCRQSLPVGFIARTASPGSLHISCTCDVLFLYCLLAGGNRVVTARRGTLQCVNRILRHTRQQQAPDERVGPAIMTFVNLT